MYRPLLEREGRCEEWDFTSSEYEVDISESEEDEEIWDIDHQECKVPLTPSPLHLLPSLFFLFFSQPRI